MEKKPFIPEAIFSYVPSDVRQPSFLASVGSANLNSPVALVSTELHTTSFIANWYPNNDESTILKYYLDVSTDGFKSFLYQNKEVTDLFFSLSGLKVYKEYQYRVRAVNLKEEISGYSNVVSVFTRMNSPIALPSTNVTSTSFTANWTGVSHATNYYLEVGTDYFFSSFVIGFDGVSINGTSITLTGLQNNKQYFYRVKAYNSITRTSSEISETIAVRTSLPAPIFVDTTNITISGFTLNWNSVQDTLDYTIDISDDNFSTFIGSYQDFSLGTITSLVVGGLNSNTTYYARLRAFNSSNNPSNYSITKIAITTIIAPTVINATNVLANSFQANWNNLSGATSYRLDVSTDNFSTLLVGYNNLTVSANFKSVIGLTSDTEYKYRVKAVGVNGLSSANSNTIVITTILDAPTVLPTTNITSTGFRVNWNLVSNSTNYFLDVATDSNFNNILVDNISTTNTYYDITNLVQLTTYYIRIRATNLNGLSANSLTIIQMTSIDAPVATVATNYTSTSFRANWNSVNLADYYYLDVSSDNFITYISGYQNKVVAGLFDTVIGLSPNITYKFRVRSDYSSQTFISVNSNEITALTLLNPPVVNNATNVTSTSFTANWTGVAGATEYRFDASSDSFTTFLAGYSDLQVLATSVSVTGLTGSTAYQYRVRAVNINSLPSVNSSTMNIETQSDAPTITGATNITEISFTLSWTASIGALSYELDISTSSLFNTFVSGYQNRSVAGTNEDVVGLDQLTTYYCRVRSVFPSSTSESSLTFSVITLAYIFEYLLIEGSGEIFNDTSPSNNDGTLLPTLADPSYTVFGFGLTEGSGISINDLSDNNNDGTFINITPEIIVFNRTVSSQSAIFIKNLDGSTLTNLTNDVLANYLYPSFTDDFTKIMFVKNVGSNYQLGIMNLDGTNLQLIGANDTFVKMTPKLSPDGSKIIYTKYNLGQTETSIWRMNFDGTGDVDVTGATYYDESPSWINNNEIVYETTVGYGGQHYIVKRNLTTNVVTQVWLNPANASMTPSISRDKSKVTFYQWESVSKQNICIVNLNGTGFLKLEDLTSSNYVPKFNSTDTKIVFASNRTGVYQIHVINTDGSNVFNFTNDNGQVTDYYPDYGLIVVPDVVFQFSLTGGSGNVLNDESLFNNDAVLNLIEPTVSSPTNITTTSFTANWEAFTGVDGYKLYVYDSVDVVLLSYNGISVLTSSYSVTGLSVETQYSYKLVSVLNGADSILSSAMSLFTAPASPTATTATTITSDGFTANYSSGANRLYLYNSGNVLLGGYPVVVSGTSYSVVGLSSVTQYSYKVSRIANSQESVLSNSISVTTVSGVKIIFLSSRTGSLRIFFMDENGTNDAELTTASEVWSATVSYRGSKISFEQNTGSGGYQIFTINKNGTGLTQLTNNAFNELDSHLNYEETKIAFVRRGAFDKIWTMDVDGNNLVEITPSGTPFVNHSWPKWSPDDTKIAYLEYDTSGDDTYQIYKMSPDGTGRTNLSNDLTKFDSSHMWSPDGTKLVFMRSDVTGSGTNSGIYNVWVMNSDGTSQTQLTTGSFVKGSPSWSQDGTKIYYYSNQDGDNEIFVMDANGSNQTKITDNAVSDKAPHYVPIIGIPLLSVSTSIFDDSFIVNWGSVLSASGYLLDVSTSSVFGTFVSGYQNRSVAGTNETVTGLIANTLYYYRVRATHEDGNSLYSRTGSTYTRLDAPTATAATNITTTSFTANWTNMTGATAYLLSLSTDNFVTFVGVYNDFNVGNVLTLNLTSLSSTTVYKYRLKAYNVNTQSIESNEITVTTL